jgi:hypothetical protein
MPNSGAKRLIINSVISNPAVAKQKFSPTNRITGKDHETEPCIQSVASFQQRMISASIRHNKQRLNEDLMLLIGRATVQMVGRHLFTIETWVQTKAIPRGISTGPNDNEAGFSLSTPISPVSVTPLLLPTQSFLYH